MPFPTPPQLTELLDRLGLATSGQVASVAPAVRRLAGDLPPFESVWIDALVQRRLLTPFQAAKLNAGRGEELAVGPLVLRAQHWSPAWAETFQAVDRQTGEQAELLLLKTPADDSTSVLQGLERLIDRLRLCSTESLLRPIRFGTCATARGDQQIWVATSAWQGKLADAWIAQHGRLPPRAVRHIARELVTALLSLHKFDTLHADLCLQSIVLAEDGKVTLRHPGVRGIVRPYEGYSLADLQPNGYESVAPERIADGLSPTAQSDVFALGCVLWHLLTGRTPFPGGNALTKLRAIHNARPGNLALLAPETSDDLIKLTLQCLDREPSRRPTLQQVAELLGPCDSNEQRELVRAMAHSNALYRVRRPARPKWQRPSQVAGAAFAVAAALALFKLWPTPPVDTTPLIPRKSIALELAPKQREAATEEGSGYDPNVQLASATSPIDEEGAESNQPEPLILPSGRIVELAELELLPGQVVCGAPSQRPIVRVPRDGLVVAAENVRFEGIDFIWDDRTPAAEPSRSQAAILAIQAARCELRRCTFQSITSDQTMSDAAPTAVLWTPPTSQLDASLNTEPAALVISSCHFRALLAVVSTSGLTSATIDASNTLAADCNQFLRLDAFPKLGDSIALLLEHVTLRDTGPVCSIQLADMHSQPGQLVIRSGGSVLALRDGDPLVSLEGNASPKPIVPFLRWQGEGTLLQPETSVAAWQRPDGLTRAIDETKLTVSGLVRGAVEFASNHPIAAASSKASTWQAPLRSIQPPGITSGIPDLPLVE